MKVQPVDSVRNAVDYIISKENYEEPPEIDVMEGSEIGDGFLSKTYAISIKSKNGETIELFVKYLPELIPEWEEIFTQAFQAEFKFYSEIYPAFMHFQEKKNLKNPFNNVSKHYRANVQNCDASPIILQNLKSLGYALKDIKQPIDDDHLKLPIQTFARFHAISYAMKDQEPQLFKKLTIGIVDTFILNIGKFGIDGVTITCVDQLRDSLDPVSDKKLLDHCDNLAEVLIQHMKSILQNIDEYSVFCQGDCWSNNMMFLYDNNTGLPIDVKLVDWQFYRVNSPVLDFAYFFCTLATKEFLNNTDHYLNLYYDTLSQRIEELGSDPRRVYPRDAFLAHWKKYSLFGLIMAFSVIKIQLFQKDEVPDLTNSIAPVASFSQVQKYQDTYLKRMKDLVEYFIDKGLL